MRPFAGAGDGQRWTMIAFVVAALCLVLGAAVPQARASTVTRAVVLAAPSLALAATTAVAWNTSWGLETGWFNDPDAEDVFPTKAAELLLLTGAAVICTLFGLAL